MTRYSTLSEDVQACFREHRLLLEALLALMDAARPYLEPAGSFSANAAMHQARCALEGREPQ